MSSGTLVICGHGMVAQRLLEHLCEGGHPFSRVVVLGAESEPAYNRVLLSSVLAGDATLDQLRLRDDAWFDANGVERYYGDPVTTIDRTYQQIITAAGRELAYDTLVLATGARPAPLGIPGDDLEGVLTFRDLRDTHQLIELSQRHGRAVVIGGGFLGLEAAEGLRCRGMAVTVLHRNPHLLNRQLDTTGSKLLAASLMQRGLSIRTGVRPCALLGKRRVRAVQLDDSNLVSTDLVITAAGITPNAGLAITAGLDCGRGIRVSRQLRTSDPAIFALGECCEIDGQTFGLVDPGYEQARVLAQVLKGSDQGAVFRSTTQPTRLKISGIPIFSCGQTRPDENTESIVWQDHGQNRYCRLLLRDGRLVGSVLFGETRDGPWYAEQIHKGNDLTPWRATLAFGRDYCEQAA
ncbi:assimilatory nitrate reductase (NADH) beta subunit [Marinobacter segnicrescens]|uniref:Assimilatory nitrate reductase (NADH) beta subunit n=1 Tax=Marinobacter segnicrescens TaxID=430453 RepID=A0A1I0EDJ2_9GAMM|nr:MULTISPECIES: FAD-dependent oxidoreductase [Marinobacter]UZD65942.1 FAD-dependent oxidoreductase [Marinobacter sp. AN1]SET42490.1 assimilatory nitrate reductase (NADH) beta subunit [Marinobacter segnicrescens]